VNVFIPSELDWAEKGVRVRQETRFPEEDTTSLTVWCAAPVEFTLLLRIPGWVAGVPEVSVNGDGMGVSAAGPGYLALRRRWREGDTVRLRLPMGLRLEPLPDDANRVSVCYGPLVLAGDLGPVEGPVEGMSGPEGAALMNIPVFVTDGRPVNEWVEPVAGRPLGFRTVDVGRPEDVTLLPFNKIHHRRYSVYWDLLTDEAVAARDTARREEEARLAALVARTLDKVLIGDKASEQAHDLSGENTRTGHHQGHNWRDAADGGWFSYQLSTKGEKAPSLRVTYWGDDVPPRTFDILIDGTVIATQSLDCDKPGELFDVEYPVPPALTQGNESVTVTFRAHEGNTAGGVFGCLMLRPE